MTTKHYHVLSGLNGLYVPDSNDTYKTRKDAEAGARWHKDSWRDAGFKVVGSVRKGHAGYFGRDTYQTGWPYRISVDECGDMQCLCECGELLTDEDYDGLCEACRLEAHHAD